MAAETGSGKTGAFCLPVLQITWEALKDLHENKKGKSGGASSSSSSDQGWRMSIQDRDKDLAITPDGLRAQSRHQKAWNGCRASFGVSGKGQYYYEAIVVDEGLCRIGWATDQAALDLGTCQYGYGYGGTGKKSNNRQFDNYGGPFGKGDVIGCYIDLDAMQICYTKNHEDLDVAFNIPKHQENQTFFPAVVLKNAEMQFNFGDQPWKLKPFEGYVGISKAKNPVTNKKSGNTAERKIVNNAPQALIIEVNYLRFFRLSIEFSDIGFYSQFLFDFRCILVISKKILITF